MAEIATDIPADDTRAKRNVIILVAAQALLGAQMPMNFIAGGLAGMMLAPTPLLATLPISLIVFGSMTTAPWISPLMQARGRRFGFMLGALAGATGAGLAVTGLLTGSFAIFLIGAYLTGIYMSAQGFYRFAATDTASDAYRPKAISYVMAGGLLSALIGPQLVKVTAEATFIPFVATYGAVAALNLAGMWMFLLLDIPRPAKPAADAPTGRSWGELLRSPAIVVAILCGMVTYALMNLVMTSAPLAVVGCGFSTGNAADIVSAHVIAMYAPSFFTGHLIARFGSARIIAAGLVLLAASGLVGLGGVELSNFYGSLILLGLGWNFGFIGATSMLTRHHSPQERGSVQGLNDLLVFGMVFVASLSSGGLMGAAVDAAHGWTAVNYAMVPFLTLAGGALIWFRVTRNRSA
ncbi:MFS transporter [Jannaschia rubra]|uniref:Major Facilitator Superfamily protein n=1 Tax=Jannaschia rubra TaxID=282197 RepID=A0A0M6XV76_9RHOB|nr:MFS transporter [Jannaschia rubra]CTQ34161.1 Major Facilitator Superfamily protein [Jannaschia rubra]SFG21765.1 Predicted arabinose efflux permease, MFS family [Jannaschia rubra]